VLASLCYNFFFLPPIYTLTITDPTNVAAFFFFIAMAVVVSNVAARVRTQAVVAMTRARTTESLYAFSRKLASTATLDDVLWATAYQTALMLKVRVVVLLPENGSIAVKAGYPPEDTLEPADLAAATWTWESDRPAGRGSDTLPGAKRLFLPMHTGRGAIGILGIDSDKPGPLLTPDQRRLLDALMDQAALAIERVRLVEDLDRAKRTAEADRLRNALLTSISHDLKDATGGGPWGGGDAGDVVGCVEQAGEGRPHRHGHWGSRAAQQVHRKPARHDQAGIRSGCSECSPARPWRNHR
jgi:two-component system sensor histidine kinase KdpD